MKSKKNTTKKNKDAITEQRKEYREKNKEKLKEKKKNITTRIKIF